MRIPCPHCGERDSGEFAYYGDAAPRRPEEGKGPPNIQAWLAVTRDTRTHEIFGAEPVRQALGRSAAEGARSA